MKKLNDFNGGFAIWYFILAISYIARNIRPTFYNSNNFLTVIFNILGSYWLFGVVIIVVGFIHMDTIAKLSKGNDANVENIKVLFKRFKELEKGIKNTK